MKAKAVILPEYNDNLIRALLSLKTEEIEIPCLKPDEVLVRLTAAPCNPSDIAFLRGGYNIRKPLPAVPGFEGTGEVVEAGAGFRHLVGRKVSCFVRENGDGTWAEYFRVKGNDCILLKEGMDSGQAACLSINPLTAIGMFKLMDNAAIRAFIVNAAGGQVPGFMRFLAKEAGMTVINIVRKDLQVAELEARGEHYVIHSEEGNFQSRLSECCRELKPYYAFDAVGGAQSGIILNTMPAGSALIVYGGLSGQPLSGIDPMGIIFKGKSISGFNLSEWISSMERNAYTQIADNLQDRMLSGEFLTTLQGSFRLEDAVAGIRTYIKSMSAGKILLVP